MLLRFRPSSALSNLPLLNLTQTSLFSSRAIHIRTRPFRNQNSNFLVNSKQLSNKLIDYNSTINHSGCNRLAVRSFANTITLSFNLVCNSFFLFTKLNQQTQSAFIEKNSNLRFHFSFRPQVKLNKSKIKLDLKTIQSVFEKKEDKIKKKEHKRMKNEKIMKVFPTSGDRFALVFRKTI